MSASLYDMLQHLVGQLPGCLHTSVIDGQTGLALASITAGDPLDGAGVDAYHSDLYRLTQVALEGLPIQDHPEGIVLLSEEANFVSTPLEDSNYHWLVVTKRETNVGFIQALMRKLSADLENSLSGLLP